MVTFLALRSLALAYLYTFQRVLIVLSLGKGFQGPCPRVLSTVVYSLYYFPPIYYHSLALLLYPHLCSRQAGHQAESGPWPWADTNGCRFTKHFNYRMAR